MSIDKIIGCAFEVYNHLGNGYSEKVYEKALLVEFEINRMKAISQYPIKVLYKGTIVGDYFADIVVEDKIILELKCCSNIDNSHIAQLINYLTATKIKVGYILNFGNDNELQFKRIVK
jgi:GxxExxY protein